MNDKILRLLGMARRAGRLRVGLREVLEAEKTELVLLSRDAGGNVLRNINRLRQEGKAETVTLPWGKTELGRVLGLPSCAVAALTDKGFAEAIETLCPRQNGTTSPEP